MTIAAFGVLVALMTAQAADVTGRWEGKITLSRDDGTSREDTALLILTQKDQAITGTVGGNDGDQHPITKGSIDGNKVTIAAKNKNNDREYQLDLTLEKDEMKGTLASGDRKGAIAVKKK